MPASHHSGVAAIKGLSLPVEEFEPGGIGPNGASDIALFNDRGIGFANARETTAASGERRGPGSGGTGGSQGAALARRGPRPRQRARSGKQEAQPVMVGPGENGVGGGRRYLHQLSA